MKEGYTIDNNTRQRGFLNVGGASEIGKEDMAVCDPVMVGG